VLDVEVLVLELPSVDGLAASPVSPLVVPSL
jgi:hypothetical protein